MRLHFFFTDKVGTTKKSLEIMREDLARAARRPDEVEGIRLTVTQSGEKHEYDFPQI